MKNERYYYSIMSLEEKRIYKLIYDALKTKSPHILVASLMDADSIRKIYLDVLYDTPLFFYVNQRVIKISRQYGCWILHPEYLFKENEIIAITHDIRDKVNKVTEKGSQFGDNMFRLEKYIHDSVVKSVAYDYEALLKTDCYNAHSIVGAFLDNKAVCEGIAKAFKLLCNEFGIKCIVVIGLADHAGKFDENMYHAWNIVKIGEESYHVDVTWDNLYDRKWKHISYDYFNVTTEDILLDHRPLDKIPACTATALNYFYSTKSFIQTYEDLLCLIEERYGEKEIMFRVKKDSSDFRNSEELKEKTMSAIQYVMKIKKQTKPIKMFFNETYKIGKIIFEQT